MADLVTHVCLALLLKRGQLALAPRRPLHLASFVAGTVAPDLLGRLPPEALGLVDRHLLTLPPGLLLGWEPFHMPVGMLITSLALALLFDADQIWPVFRSLLLGMLLHLAVDLLQDHAGGGYLLLFPLSTQPYELAWLGTEHSVWLVPLLLLLTTLAWRSPTTSPLRSPAPAPPPRAEQGADSPAAVRLRGLGSKPPPPPQAPKPSTGRPEERVVDPRPGR